MRKFLWIVTTYLVILFSLTSCSGSRAFAQTFEIAEKDFDSPEAAVSYFIKSIASNDFGKALQACALNEDSASFDFKAYTEFLHTITWGYSLSPSNYTLYVQLNKVELASRIGRQVKYFCYSLVSSEKDYNYPVLNPAKDRIDTFVTWSNPARLSSLQIEEIGSQAILKTPKARENSLKQAKYYGADDSSERLVLLSFEGKNYVEGFHLLKYGRAWRIDSLNAAYANTAIYGSVEETTKDDFEKLVAEQ